MRLLFVMESTPDVMNKIMDRNPQVARILRNGWAQLAVLDPWSPRISLLRDGRFEEFQPIEGELPWRRVRRIGIAAGAITWNSPSFPKSGAVRATH